jgi:large subunit ribosomal protein L4
MIELPVHNRGGEVVGKVELDEADFGGEIRHELLRQVVLMYEAARRAGMASTRRRSEIRAGHGKPWRQKGTGRARAGFRGSPLWRGGGVVFGPKPREYRLRLPRKAVRAATRSAYLAKLQSATIVVDELEAEAPRTREMAATLASLGIGQSCLVAIEAHNPNLWKSARNLPGVSMKPVAEINAYDLLHSRQLLITRPALEQLVESMRRTRRVQPSEPGAEAPAEPLEVAGQGSPGALSPGESNE